MAERTPHNAFGLLADPMTCDHPLDCRRSAQNGPSSMFVACVKCGAWQIIGFKKPKGPPTTPSKDEAAQPVPAAGEAPQKS